MENYQIKDVLHFALMENSLIIKPENVQLLALLVQYNNMLTILLTFVSKTVLSNPIIFLKMKHTPAYLLARLLLLCLQTTQQEDVLNIVQEEFSKHLPITQQDNVFLYAQMVHTCKIQQEHAFLNARKGSLTLLLNFVLHSVLHIITGYFPKENALIFALRQHHNYMHKITLTCANHLA